MYLHSNLVIFKCVKLGKYVVFTILLYIPIWLYSNAQAANAMSALNSFTFQSGYIQIICSSSIMISKSDFTFQSGYIQIMTSTK